MEVDGSAPDEGGCETPGHPYQEKTDSPAEDGWGGVRGERCGLGSMMADGIGS